LLIIYRLQLTGSDSKSVKAKVAGGSGNDVEVHTDKNQVNAVDDIFKIWGIPSGFYTWTTTGGEEYVHGKILIMIKFIEDSCNCFVRHYVYKLEFDAKLHEKIHLVVWLKHKDAHRKRAKAQ
jgi:hypothetical protein